MSKLFNIEKEVIDIANKNSNDMSKFKNNIESYFKKINERELENLKKKERYVTNYENKRVRDKNEYENFLTEKNALKTIFQNEKTKISLYNYLKLKCPVKNNIPDLYTYENIILDERVIIPRPSLANVINNKVKKTKKDVLCPEGKEINPVTGRCVKICDDGKIRDPVTGICKTIKIEKVAKVKKVVKVSKIVNVPAVQEDEIKPDVPKVAIIPSIPKFTNKPSVIQEDEIKPDVPKVAIIPSIPKITKKPSVIQEDEIKPDVPKVENVLKVVDIKNIKCPEGKEINPLTGRCVKKCEDGKIRDPATGICKSIKINKLENIADIKCPEGKEVNPLTGRFVNKCKDDEERDVKTGKCKKKLKK